MYRKQGSSLLELVVPPDLTETKFCISCIYIYIGLSFLIIRTCSLSDRNTCTGYELHLK